MSKNKRKHMPRAARPNAPVTRPRGPVVTGKDYPTDEIRWWREAVEGLVIAIVLALLIRGFEAEAFVIPTGSMAPTLRGNHKDIKCEECGHEYAAGSSDTTIQQEGPIVGAVCPLCRAPKAIEYQVARDATFDGDRILVNKFAYDLLGEPERFDVIVFKNPNESKQNYIKRLLGLPGEMLRIHRGDVYYRKLDSEQQEFTIARKPPEKLKVLLQEIHDTNHPAMALAKAGVPARWQPLGENSQWSTSDDLRTYSLKPSAEPSWLRYHHITPLPSEWQQIRSSGNATGFAGAGGQLVDDFYAYNTQLGQKVSAGQWNAHGFENRSVGKNWVGDLAVAADVTVASDAGELYLDLVEGGWHFRCTIDVATGTATLSINEGQQSFDDADTLQAETKVKGPGKYRLMLSNADNEMILWVNGKVVTFPHPAHYHRPDAMTMRPVYHDPSAPGDLAPAGVGGKQLQADVTRLRVYRDKYYISVRGYQVDTTASDHGGLGRHEAVDLFRDPRRWATAPHLEPAKPVEFILRDFEDDRLDQFFPMGDNSPQSLDARIWCDENQNPERGHYVERQFLIGEAVVIYYPHPWHVKMPGEQWNSKRLLFWPKFSRMGVIR